MLHAKQGGGDRVVTGKDLDPESRRTVHIRGVKNLPADPWHKLRYIRTVPCKDSEGTVLCFGGRHRMRRLVYVFAPRLPVRPVDPTRDRRRRRKVRR